VPAEADKSRFLNNALGFLVTWNRVFQIRVLRFNQRLISYRRLLAPVNEFTRERRIEGEKRADCISW
jgi:hypothetical protein